tara:strand:- start:352 stop:1536 length:1185 start_codon:yes stop_codon:yes gene_type:complete
MGRASYHEQRRRKPFDALKHDSTATIGHWKPFVDSTLVVDPRFNDDDLFEHKPEEPPDADTFPISATSRRKDAGRTTVNVEDPVPVQSVIDAVEPRLVKEELTDRIREHRSGVKGQFGRRREVEKSALTAEEISFAASVVKHLTPFDDSKLKKMEAEMARKFNEKVSAPTKVIRVTRDVEQKRARVTEACRGNELYAKGDYIAALAEYDVAAGHADLAPFVHLNRGNAYKTLSFRPQAAACYRQVLDATQALRNHPERLLHACALNNLGAVCKDGGKLEQARQHFSSALALFPRSHLALKNAAELHMHYARQLSTAEAPALVPPQHEMANNLFQRSMDVDWHLPLVFSIGPPDAVVPIRIDTIITGEREEGQPEHNPNEVYHSTINLTHVHRAN